MIEIMIYVGKTRFFASTGVIIAHGSHSANVLTSASLVRDSGDDIQKINHNLRVVTVTTICSFCFFHLRIC
jgi:hypothetical protein